MTDDYSFDGWGKLTSSTGSTANSQLYKGEYLAYRKDPDAGPELQYSTHHRNYNPQTGVFTAADPAKDDLNLYRYVKNNPVNQVDPSGLQEEFLPKGPETPAHLREPGKPYLSRDSETGKYYSATEFGLDDDVKIVRYDNDQMNYLMQAMQDRVNGVRSGDTVHLSPDQTNLRQHYDAEHRRYINQRQPRNPSIFLGTTVETGGLVLRSDGSAGPPEIGEQEPAGFLRVSPELIPHINDARINPYAAEPVTEVVQLPSSPILEDVANEKHVFRGLDKLSSQGKALTADWRSAFPNIKGQQEIEFNRILIGIFQTIQHSVENVILVLSLVPGGGTAKVIAYKLSGEEISNTEVALSLVGDLFEIAAVRNLVFAPRSANIPSKIVDGVSQTRAATFTAAEIAKMDRIHELRRLMKEGTPEIANAAAKEVAALKRGLIDPLSPSIVALDRESLTHALRLQNNPIAKKTAEFIETDVLDVKFRYTGTSGSFEVTREGIFRISIKKTGKTPLAAVDTAAHETRHYIDRLVNGPNYVYTKWHEFRAWQWGRNAYDYNNPIMKGKTRMSDADIWRKIHTDPEYKDLPLGSPVEYDPMHWGISEPR